VGVGKGSAPYYIGQKSAAARATRAAERDLAKRLERDSELVPCPKCNWVNEDLVRRYRRRLYRRAPLLIISIVVGGLIVAPLVGLLVATIAGDNSNAIAIFSLATLAICLLSPAWVLLIRRRLRHRVDPNGTYPRRPALPPGTPPPLVEKRDPESGDPYLEPVEDDSEESPEALDWAVFRTGQLRFIPLCCMCLDNARTTYRPPIKASETSEMAVPVCPDCQAKLKWKWWRTLLLVAVVMLAISAGAALAVPGLDALGRWILFSIMGFFLSLLLGIVIAGQLARPYKLKTVDRSRGIYQFAAANPRYTALIAENLRKAELGETE
jgi:hypothetical protein